MVVSSVASVNNELAVNLLLLICHTLCVGVRVQFLVEVQSASVCQSRSPDRVSGSRSVPGSKSRLESESESGSGPEIRLKGTAFRSGYESISESTFAYRSMSRSGLSKLIAIPRVCIIYLAATKNNR